MRYSGEEDYGTWENLCVFRSTGGFFKKSDRERNVLFLEEG